MRWEQTWGTGSVIACSRAACCGVVFSRHALQTRCRSQGMKRRPSEQIAIDAMQKRHQVQVLGSTVFRAAVQRWLLQHKLKTCGSRLSAGAMDATLDSQPSRINASSDRTCNDCSGLQRLAQAHVLHQCAPGCHAKTRMEGVICQCLLC